MKKQIKRGVASLLALFGTLLCCATAQAQVKLYIPDFTVNMTQPATVNVMLDNSEPVLAYSFKIELPEELEIVPNSMQKTDRFNQGQTVNLRNNTVLCSSMQGYTFLNDSGSVGTFQVRATNKAKLGQQVEMRIYQLAVTCKDFSHNPPISEQTVKVTFSDNVSLTLSTAPQSFVINPSGVQEITVAMDNNAPVQGLQMDLTLPDGFTFVTAPDGNIFEQLPRLSGGSQIQPLTQGNMTRIVIFDLMENQCLAAGNGAFMKFTVMAPADFSAETAQISFSNIQGSVDFRTVDASDANVALTNGKAAYDKAQAVIAGLEQKLADALQTIATEAPDVKDNFTGEAISNDIDALKQAVEDAYADLSLTPDYDNVMAPAAGIEAAIEALVADAKDAENKYQQEVAAEAARQEAYKNAKAVVAGLEQKLAEALATIAETCPDVKDNFKGEAITASIEAMKGAIDAALENKTIVEKYDELVAPAAGIETAIATLISDAQAAQKTFEENAALEAARQNANNELASLDKALADALAKIAAECPDVKYLFPGTEIQQQITVLRNAVNTAYENKTLAADYDDVMAPVAGIRDSIAKLIADAQAAQKKYEDDAAAEKALLDAYKQANEAIEALRTSLAGTVATINEICPDVKADFQGENIEKSINTLKEAVDNAFNTKTLVADYDDVMAPAKDIEAAIAALLTSAQAAQKAYEEAEAARQAANKAAYEADLAEIAALQKSLEDAKATIEQQYPGYDFTAEYNTIQEAIDNQKRLADEEYESVAEEGVYDNDVDSQRIEDMIAKMIENAKTNGIDMIMGEKLTDGDRIFTLEGIEVSRPQQGKVNIIVKSDGRILKTYVR